MELFVNKDSYFKNEDLNSEEVISMQGNESLEEIEANERKREQLIKEERKLSDSSYEEAALVVANEHPELFKDAFNG